MNIKKYLLKQQGADECGSASLRMLLAISHQNKTYLTLPLEEEAYNFQIMQEIAATWGVTTTGYKVLDKEELGTIRGPFIVAITTNNVKHFLVAENKGTYIYLNDPVGEHYKIPLAVFIRNDIKNVLVVDEVLNLSPPRGMKVKMGFGPYFAEVMFLCSLLTGFLFLGHQTLDLISYLAFTLAALCKIMSNEFLMRRLARFDEEVLAPKVVELHDNFDLKLQNLMEAKGIIFTTPLTIFLTLASLILISTFFILDSLYYVSVILFLFTFVLFDNHFAQNSGLSAYQLKNDLSGLEVLEGESRRNLFLKITGSTSRLAKTFVYRTIIVHFALAVLIFVLMYFSDTYALNYFIFYFFGFSYFYYELKKLVKSASNRHEYYRALNIFTSSGKMCEKEDNKQSNSCEKKQKMVR